MLQSNSVKSIRGPTRSASHRFRVAEVFEQLRTIGAIRKRDTGAMLEADERRTVSGREAYSNTLDQMIDQPLGR